MSFAPTIRAMRSRW